MFDDEVTRYVRRRIANPLFGAPVSVLRSAHGKRASRAFYALRERENTLNATLSVLHTSAVLAGSRTPHGGGLLSARRQVAQQHPLYKQFLSECARRKLSAAGESVLAAFFSTHRCAIKPALAALTAYWRFYEARQYRRLPVGDVAAALQSWLLCPPLSSDCVDHYRRPIVTYRANLWVDGDPTQPSLDDIRNTLMWIGQLVQSTSASFVFVWDLFEWRRDLNYAPDVFAFILQTLQSGLSSQCELVLLLDAPPSFDAVWEQLALSCKPSFRRRVERCTRAELTELYVDDFAVLGDLGGSHPRVDMRVFIEGMRKAEADWHHFVPTAVADIDLSPVEVDDADEDSEEASSASPARSSSFSGSQGAPAAATKSKRTLGTLFGFGKKEK